VGGKMENRKKTKIPGLSLFQTVALPLIVWLVFEIIDRSFVGTSVISTIADVKALLRTLLTSFSFALAINTNLTSGRMDLSLGAQMYLGCILGGNIALYFGLGGAGVLVLSMLAGGLAGRLIGVLFVNMGILPMVLGLGMTLVFETMSFSLNNQQGLMLFGKQGVSILSDVTFIIVVASILVVTMTYLYQYSSFGYKRRAIQGSQKLASESGINIFWNCIQCYALAGVLVACAGVFETAYSGTLTPVMGMSSNLSVFKNMFPMFLGIWIGSFSHNQIVGVLMGSLSVKLMTMGMSQLALQSSTQSIIVYMLFLIFTIYRMNINKLHYFRDKRERIKLAKEARMAMQTI
jgi:ribose/xylose/arabinose/galactoside ABC-type transport system permease subunit